MKLQELILSINGKIVMHPDAHDLISRYMNKDCVVCYRKVHNEYYTIIIKTKKGFSACISWTSQSVLNYVRYTVYPITLQEALRILHDKQYYKDSKLHIFMKKDYQKLLEKHLALRL